MARAKRRSGIDPLAYMGVEPVAPNNFIVDNRAPKSSDYNGYNLGDEWLNTVTETSYKLVSKEGLVATWVELACTALTIDFNADSGTATPSGGTLNVYGGTNITTSGATDTLTTALDTTLTGLDSITTDTITINTSATFPYLSEGVVQSDSSGVLFSDMGSDGQLLISSSAGPPIWANITNSDGNITITDGANSIDLALGDPLVIDTLTVNDLTVNTSATFPFLDRGVVQADASGVLFSDEGTDGQLLISSSSGAPAWANLMSTDGSVVITNGSNSIDLSASGEVIGGGDFVNIGITVDTGASTLTIHSADGSAFSASNQGLIKFKSKDTPGTFVTIEVIANVTLTWSDMDGNTMGTEGSKAWDNDMPLYLYAVLIDGETDLTFGLARVPHHAASGTEANLGSPGSATADDSMSVFLLENVTLADFANEPVTLLGSVTATKDGSDSWSFSTIDPGTDGIGAYQIGVTFEFVSGQQGADNTYLYSSGGTVPTFDTGSYYYNIDKNGYFSCDVSLGDCSVAGTGTSTGDGVNILVPIEGTRVRRAGIWSVDVDVSTSFSGIYRGLYFDQQLPSGFYGMIFVQEENNNYLKCGWIDTTTTSNPLFWGAHSFMLLNNQVT